MGKQQTTRVSKWYKGDDEAVHFTRKRVQKQKKQEMRKSIEVGSVLIILSGKYRGKRVICLKQLESGLLLVTGPFQVNGVPLKRVNQAFVMATSGRVDVKGVDVSKVNDQFFHQEKNKKVKNSEGKFFQQELTQDQQDKAAAVQKNRLAVQKQVDAALLQNIKAQDMMKQYLAARFRITNTTRVHDLHF